MSDYIVVESEAMSDGLVVEELYVDEEIVLI